jgi:hypothetical protein
MTAAAKNEPTLASAMALAFAEIEGAAKDKINPHFKSKYADLGSVMDAIKPPLVKQGLFYIQRCEPSEDGVIVATILRHGATGEEMDLGKLYVPANKRDAQGFGSALTYARRYALMTAFGVPAEDDDGNAASRSAPANANNGNGHANGKIDDHQYATLVTLAENVGADTKRFCEYFGVQKLTDIRAADFDKAVAALQAKAKKENA